MPAQIHLRATTPPAQFNELVWGQHIFNSRRDTSRTPFAVCKAETVSDIVACVQLAKANNCRVSVRSGGHSWAAWSVRHDAVLIDLLFLDQKEGEAGSEYEYDAGTKVVRCPPSATGRDLNEFLGEQEEGGRGWACESLVGIDVVTADGEVKHCSATENSSLFWAARGAGPGFPAIATRLHLATRPLTSLYQTLYFLPPSSFTAAHAWISSITPTLPPSFEVVMVTGYFPLNDYAEPMALINILAFLPPSSPSASTKDEDEEDEDDIAATLFEPIHEALPSELRSSLLFTQECAPTDLEEQYAMQTAANPEGHRYIVDNVYTENNTENIGALLEPVFTSLPTKQSTALWYSMQCTTRQQPKDMALSLESGHYVALYAVCEEEKDDGKCEGWVRDGMSKLERHSVGSYLGDADFRARTTRFWGAEEGRRLNEVRREWDPEGRVCGFLDEGDGSGVSGLGNEFEWKR
ncbi:hypothetical protein OQA88_9012 [Cercophora sp. LCS_1]